VCFICGTLPTGTLTVCIPYLFPPKENHNVGLLQFNDDHDHICYRFAQVQIFGGKSNVFKSLQYITFSANYSSLRKTVTNVVVIVIEAEEPYVSFGGKGSECKR
jgi:hypothetical protein